MAIRIVIGAQWGDEGKGKIIDLLSNNTQIVARYQGGANAGHTLKFDDTTIVLHLVPSGIFHEGTTCIIGNGVVIDPAALIQELEEVRSHGITPEDRLFIASNAHVILPYHKLVDKAKEVGRGDDAIGTTGRGIGPAYIHKVARNGIRMMDLLDESILRKKLAVTISEANQQLEVYGSSDRVELESTLNELLKAATILRPFICDTGLLLYQAWKQGKNILLEGAQGALLDVDHGTYPFVTSSNPTAGGACIGTGLPPLAITHAMGIMKAYCTRVGNGPFPSELFDTAGEKIREVGHEFGATTGRPRRTGWLDLVAMKYACRINGLNELTMTKLDVLDGFETIKVCTAYEIDGVRTQEYPLSSEALSKATPIYTELKGWNCPTTHLTSSESLPEEVHEYIRYIETILRVPIVILSNGPKRSETILLRDLP